ncbi:MAG TPA: M12 family metallo-peptidase [Anaeromyxobacteraceae bacterium]|nr:M12 family metallo-peptidase [Anaeromyxobacteraceae bacterium]
MAAGAAAALAFASGCATSSTASIAEDQREEARALSPAAVQPVPGAPARDPSTLRVMQVRAYADDDYRTETPDWSARVQDQIARASAVLEAQFGVRLSTVSVRPWARPDRAGDLQLALGQLAALDPARDVDWVVAFVSSSATPVALHEEGVAHLFGRHFVLRGTASTASFESAQFEDSLYMLSAGEREALVRERRLHIEVAIFLHEWAHTLGAVHDCATRSIMSPVYDSAQTEFSPWSVRLVEVGLRHREAARAEGFQAWAAAYHAEVAPIRAAAAGCRERDEGLAQADASLAEGAASGPRSMVPVVMDARDAARLADAFRLARAQDMARLADALAPLAERHPREPHVAYLGCVLAHGRAELDAIARCRAASDLDGALPEALLVLGHTLLDRGERAEAMRALVRAEVALGEAVSPAGAWSYLARLYATDDACAAAERAAHRAGDDATTQAAARHCARVRREIGLPRQGTAVPIEREREYVEAVRAALGEVDARRFDGARTRADALRVAYPEAAGADLVMCLAWYERGRGPARARTKVACSAAVAADPEALRPHLVLGFLACEEARWKEARLHLRRAIELDDNVPDAWRWLAMTEERLGDATAVAVLKSRYREKFGTELRSPR